MSVLVILSIDSRFWLAFPVDVGLELAEPS